MREYSVKIVPVRSYSDSAYRWSVSLEGKPVGEGETTYRHAAVRAVKQCVKAHAKGKPNTDAREFTIRA